MTALELVHERMPNATPNRNAHIESWHSVLEAECLGNQIFTSLAQAYNVIAQWITFYNERQLHGSLQDWPPDQFYAWAPAPGIQPVRCYILMNLNSFRIFHSQRI